MSETPEERAARMLAAADDAIKRVNSHNYLEQYAGGPNYAIALVLARELCAIEERMGERLDELARKVYGDG